MGICTKTTALRIQAQPLIAIFCAGADDIYRDDVVFKDPRNTVKGKGNYRRLFRFVRVLGRIVFSRVAVRVQRIWQLDDRCVSVRWEVSGVPRIPWEVEGVFDGVSYFKLDKCGHSKPFKQCYMIDVALLMVNASSPHFVCAADAQARRGDVLF